MTVTCKSLAIVQVKKSISKIKIAILDFRIIVHWNMKHAQKVSVLNFYRLQQFLFDQNNYLVTLVHM